MLARMEAGLMRSRIDWILVGAVFGLVSIGTLAVLSAASPLPYYGDVVERHFIAFGVGLLGLSVGMGLNYQIFEDQSKTLYGLTVLMLVAVLIVGVTMRGQRSWFRLPHFTFQPSELARICTVLVLASFLDHRANRIHELAAFLQAFAIVAPVLFLILKEPDFSSTLVFFPMILSMLFCSGASISHLAAMAGYGALTLGLPLLWTLCALRPELVEGSPVLQYFVSLSSFQSPLLWTILAVAVAAAVIWWFMLMARNPVHWIYFTVTALVLAAGLCSGVFVNHQLKHYQRKRFVAFLAPEADPQGAAYNVHQALVAIGSGGVLGKGAFSGTQAQLGFLPERHTDFIFAVVGEELGFVGALTVLLLYLTVIWRVVNAARLARDRYGYLVCSGIAAMFAAYLLVNVGMCLGVSPVAGIPLPLLSYGGSSLVVTLWSLGIVVNIYSKHYAFV